MSSVMRQAKISSQLWIRTVWCVADVRKLTQRFRFSLLRTKEGRTDRRMKSATGGVSISRSRREDKRRCGWQKKRGKKAHPNNRLEFGHSLGHGAGHELVEPGEFDVALVGGPGRRLPIQ